MIYRTVQTVIRFALSVFFRRVRVVGGHLIPAEGQGAVVFVGNHPNSLIDPALLIAQSGRKVSFAAKDILFRSRLLRPILHAVGAVPIRRAKDHGGGKVDNSAAFDALFTRLADGGAIGIFPEGISHDEAQLQPLKTGAARITLGAVAKTGAQVRIVPVGLNYSRAGRFRSSVLLRFGEPILMDADPKHGAWLTRFQTDERAACRALTTEIDGALRALTINAEDWDTLRLLDTVRRLYQPPGLSVEARIELSQRFSEGYERVKDSADIQRLLYAVAHFRDRLDAIGLNERDLTLSFRWSDIVVRFWQRAGRALFWLPLAIPGAVVHVPLAMAAGALGGKLTPRSDVIATTKLMVGAVLSVLTWATLTTLAVHAWGLIGLIGLALLPAMAWATLRVVERYANARELLLSLAAFWRFRQEVAELRRERRRLQRAVVGAVARHLPPDMEPMFLEASREQLGVGEEGDDDGAEPAWLTSLGELFSAGGAPAALTDPADDASSAAEPHASRSHDAN
ncbi:MAG: 1-acyl-sn-glycerol-3-phosphate acyltransferase [Myxococcales bacterium]|nr:1-acyl-sn-glycerol-3-phosphate acyltransferase [Myxococcales bacterium]